MKPIARLAAFLLLAFGLLLVPVTSAAGDPSETGGSSAGNGTGGTDGDPGTQAPGGVSVPRVMVKDFSTAPQSVFAGQEFTVKFSLWNTSSKTRVQNLLVTVSSPDSSFLPVGGSSSIFVSGIRAERVSEHSMTFRALPSLEAKPYQLTIEVEYEDPSANAYQSSETLAVEVNQELRADTSVPQVTPQMLTVGQQGSMTFTIQNHGKAQLFNARAVIGEGQSLAPAEAFVGSIEPGASGSVDMTVTALTPASGPVDVVVTYEDATGEVFTLTKKAEVPVMEVQEPEVYPEEPMAPSEEGAGIPIVAVVIGVALLAMVGTAVAVIVTARRRKAAREDAESLAALSGQNLIDDDWA